MTMSIYDDTFDVPMDPDATSIYDLGKLFPTPRVRSGSMLRRLIRSTRQIVDGLRAALAAGWDVGPELAHEQRRLALLEELA